MTIRRIGDIRFTTHAVQISKDTFSDRIYLFKHTDTRCEFAQFDKEDEAAEFILEPFPALIYSVNIDGDPTV